MRIDHIMLDKENINGPKGKCSFILCDVIDTPFTGGAFIFKDMVRMKFPFKIYVLTSPSGKQYVGQTMQKWAIRWRCHCNCAKKKDTFLARAIKKYGGDAFTMQIVATPERKCEANKAESFWIEKLNTLWPNGYNMSPLGSGGVPGSKHTEESKLQQSNHKKQFYEIPENREKQSLQKKQFYATPEGIELRKKKSEEFKNPEAQAKCKAGIGDSRKTKEYRESKSIEQKRVWSNPELKKKHSDLIKEQYKNGGRITWNKGKKTRLYKETTIQSNFGL